MQLGIRNLSQHKILLINELHKHQNTNKHHSLKPKNQRFCHYHIFPYLCTEFELRL